MKFSLVFEAIDNASKAFGSIAKAHKGMSEASAKGAAKVASAFEKSTRATGKQAQATWKAARLAR